MQYIQRTVPRWAVAYWAIVCASTQQTRRRCYLVSKEVHNFSSHPYSRNTDPPVCQSACKEALAAACFTQTIGRRWKLTPCVSIDLTFVTCGSKIHMFVEARPCILAAWAVGDACSRDRIRVSNNVVFVSSPAFHIIAKIRVVLGYIKIRYNSASA